MTNEFNQLPEIGFLRLPDVLKLIPVSKSAWWDGIQKGFYPKAVPIGKRVSAWRVEDIRQLISAISEGRRGL